jgi:hypothetical protein
MQFLRDNVFLVGVVAVLVVGLSVLLALYLGASSDYDDALKPKLDLARDIGAARLVRPDREINAQIQDRHREIEAARSGVKDVMGGQGLRYPVMKVLDSDAFPVANKYAQSRALTAFTDAYIRECQQMLSVLSPARFVPRAEYDELDRVELALITTAIEEEKRAAAAAATTTTPQSGGGGGGGAPTYSNDPYNPYNTGPGMPGPGMTGAVSPTGQPVVKDARTRATENVTARVQLQQARSGKMYASLNSLDRHWDRQITITSQLPNVRQLWEAQVNLWTQKDILVAIHIVNDAAQRNVDIREAIDAVGRIGDAAAANGLDLIAAINIVNGIAHDAAQRGIAAPDAFNSVLAAAAVVSAAAQKDVDLFTGGALAGPAKKALDNTAAVVDKIAVVARQNGLRLFDLAAIINAADARNLKVTDAIATVKQASRNEIDLFDAASLLNDATRKGLNILDVVRSDEATERVTAAAQKGFDLFDADALIAAARAVDVDLLAALLDAATQKEIVLAVAKLPSDENSVLASGVRSLEKITVNRSYVTSAASTSSSSSASRSSTPANAPPGGPQGYGGGGYDPYGGGYGMQSAAATPTGPNTAGFTGRGSSKDYDVVHYNFTVVMPPQRILDLTKALYSLGFHTVLNVEFTALSAPPPVATATGARGGAAATATDTSVVPLYYGPGPMARVTISGELLLPTALQRGVVAPSTAGQSMSGQQTETTWVVAPLVPYEVLAELQSRASDALRPEDVKRINDKNNMQPATAARP